MTEEQKKKLERQLWNIANELRGRMDADEFRDYILGFIFYKYLSERLHIYADKILKQDGLVFADLDVTDAEDREVLEAVEDACIEALGYYLKPDELFSAIAKKGAQPGSFILDDLTTILNNIQNSTMGAASEDDFDNLFEDLDLTSTKLGRTNKARNDVIAKVLVHLDDIDFQLEEADSDVLGDAYEYLIGKFASGAGKTAGEFYTPQQVSTILARIVTTGKTRLRSAYDPTCGSGSLLLRVAKEVKNVEDFFVRIPRKMGIDSTASWAAIPRLGQCGRRVHGVSPDRSGQAVSSRPRASACSRRREAGGGRYGRAGPGWHLPGSGRRWPRASARPEAGW